MLSKCANPGCSTPFHYLRDGKLFQIDSASGRQQTASAEFVTHPKQPHKIEFFWLCAECAATMTLAFQRGKGVVAIPLTPAARHAAAS
jgi:hypothetical protein